MTFQFPHRRLQQQRPSHIPGERSKEFAAHIASIPEQKRTSLQQRMLLRHLNGECIGCTHQGVTLGVNGKELPFVSVMRGFFAPPEFCDCELGKRYQQRLEHERKQYARQSALENYNHALRLFEGVLLREKSEVSTFANWPLQFKRFAGLSDEDYQLVVSERLLALSKVEAFIKSIKEPELNVHKRGLVLQGYPGVGKTGLLSCTKAALLAEEYYMLCINTPALLSCMKQSEQADQMLYTLQHFPILALDNLGDPQSMDIAPYTVRRIFLEIFDARYTASLPTFVTTELDNPQLCDQFGDAIFSRMQGLCFFHELPGIDLR